MNALIILQWFYGHLVGLSLSEYIFLNTYSIFTVLWETDQHSHLNLGPLMIIFIIDPSNDSFLNQSTGWSIKCEKKVKHVHYNFPESKVISSIVLFCQLTVQNPKKFSLMPYKTKKSKCPHLKSWDLWNILISDWSIIKIAAKLFFFLYLLIIHRDLKSN